MFAYYEEIQKRKDRIEWELERLKQKEPDWPPGELICTRNEGRYKWYLKEEETTSYLPKQEWQLAQLLAEKKYFLLHIQELERELSACSSYLQKSDTGQSTAKMLENKGYGRLLREHGHLTACDDLQSELKEWMEAQYEGKEDYSEKLNICGTRGYCLRSKSEAIIDKVLFDYGIPFRYECKLILEDIAFYPDFTIRHPKTGKLYYWEHMGMMDNPEYVSHACKKVGVYCRNGIIPSVQLILTYETREHPLGIDVVERTIQQYFL